MKTAVVLGLLAPFAFGNYLFRSITVNRGRSADWEFVRETANNPASNPIEDVSSPLLSCYEKIGRPVSAVQTVAPGTRIRFPSSVPIGHPGPVLFYLARVPDGQDVNSWTPTGNVWFKVDQYGNTPGVNNQFAVEMTEVFTTIPASLRPGNYLLRAEHIALHSYQKPQFSLACAQLQVTGSGPDFPESFVSFPGAYKADDVGLLFDIYAGTNNPKMGEQFAASEPFTIKDEPIENLRPLKVIVIGAGFSGIYTTIRLSQRLKNVKIQTYEQNEETAGVWWMNRYPGIACDIPSYSYQFSFAPTPNWSSLYAPGPEIRRYMQGVAQKYGANRFIKTSHAVESCVWNARQRQWQVKVQDLKSGLVFEETADLVISAKGGLNQIKWPRIKGIEDYQGKLMHSAAWDESVDLRNKRVGVIGNGSSAIQIVPAIQKLDGIKVWNFARSPTWVSTSFGDLAMTKMGMDPKINIFPEEHRKRVTDDPELFYKLRKTLEEEASKKYRFALRGSEEQAIALEKFTNHMKEQLKSRPDIYEAIIPTFAPGCRRLTPGPGYLEALQEQNVTFSNTPIQQLTSTGLKLQTGEQVDLDAIVCATGFDVQAAPSFSVTGRNGVTLQERWSPHPETYLAIAVDGFPNFFLIGGPNSGLGSGSLLAVLEAQADYAIKMIRKLQKEDYATCEIRPELVADFSRYIDEYFKQTVYTEDCSSWYRSYDKGDRIVGLWPGSSLHCLEALRAPRWEDFVFESVEPRGNLLRWLGSGTSLTLSDGDPAWYIDPRYVDVPEEGRPEEAQVYHQRPFSH
ncbi:hypothetical protein ACHAQF_003345 [Verticillium nonalfalfae]